MASVTASSDEPSLKPSFAKILASNYNSKYGSDAGTQALASSQAHGPGTPSKSRAAGEVSRSPAAAGLDDSAKHGLENPRIGRVHLAEPTSVNADGTHVASRLPGNVAHHAPSVAQRLGGADDGATQLSSSDDSIKPPSLDGKSIASGTTFALDEKESLRPDDSASLRAVEEEDMISPPGSAPPGSRVGSEIGAARAFQDQLQEIAALPQRGIIPNRFPSGIISTEGSALDLNRSAPPSQPIILAPVSADRSDLDAPQSSNAPDEKLLEALESQRDRLFVLKLEQDLIDFVKDPKETELSLPNCNAFYRMLAHRLADYYLLGHIVDESMTAVKISKTPFCRIPPPLSSLSQPSVVSTPPLDLPARKIMRRGDEAANTRPSSGQLEDSARASPDIGNANDSSQVSNDPKNKSGLSREEREAKYKEARERIFGNSNQSPAVNDLGNLTESKDISRSSSASEKKRHKKSRNNSDDGFEARSQYNAFYTSGYPVNDGLNGDSNPTMFNMYPVPVSFPQYKTVPAHASPSFAYAGLETSPSGQQLPWPATQYQSSSTPYMPSYDQSQGVSYDLSSDFQRGMQSFQNANGSGSALGPTMTSVYGVNGQSITPPWVQAGQVPFSNSPQYMPGMPGDVNVGSQNKLGQFNQFPQGPNSFSPQQRNQSFPMMSAYNRPSFNPQSQTFVPSVAYPGSFQSSQGNHFASPGPSRYISPQKTPSSIPARPNMLPGSSSSLNSPNISSANVAGKQSPSNPRGAFQSTSAGLSTTPSKSTSHSAPPQTSSHGSSNVPPQSTIAKWGTPSHLPPKPPPPASQPLPAPVFPPNSLHTSRPPGSFPNSLPSTSTITPASALAPSADPGSHSNPAS